MLLLPSVLINVERLAFVREFKLLNKFTFMKNYPLLKALSSKSYDRIMNNETLETIGDTVLKTIVTLHLFKNAGNLSEGNMTKDRGSLINNEYLNSKAMESGLQYFLKTECLPVKKWLPPNFALKSKQDTDKESEEV